MIDLSQEIDSLTSFQRDTTTFLGRLRETGKPVVLTVDGKAALVVQDVASYQRLLERVDRLEAIAGIQRGLEDVNKRRTRTNRGNPCREEEKVPAIKLKCRGLLTLRRKKPTPGSLSGAPLRPGAGMSGCWRQSGHWRTTPSAAP